MARIIINNDRILTRAEILDHSATKP